MLPNNSIQKFLAVLVLSILMACGGSPDAPPSTAPVISAIYPNSGPKAGGTTVTISGSRFVSGASVSFGLISASVTSVTATQIVATTPGNVSGAVSVTVMNPDRQSATLNGGFTFIAPTPQEFARSIMGANYFGVEENARYFGITLSPADAATYADIYYTEATLRAKSATHMLVLVPPGYSILDLQAKLPAGTIAFCDTWNAGQLFAGYKNGGNGWQLIRKTVAPGSLGLAGIDQWTTFQRPQEDTLEARPLVFAMAAHYMATGEVLMSGIYARSLISHTAPPGTTYLMTVFAGGNAYGGVVGICSDWESKQDPAVGAGALWKLDGKLVVP